MFAIVNSKDEVGIDKWDATELNWFDSKKAAAFFLKWRKHDVILAGKAIVKEVESE